MARIIGGDFKKNKNVKLIWKNGGVEALVLPIGFMKTQLYAAKNIQSVSQETQIDKKTILHVSFTNGKSVLLSANARETEGLISLGLMVANAASENCTTSEQKATPKLEKKSPVGAVLVLVLLFFLIPLLLKTVALDNGHVAVIFAAFALLLYVACLWKPLPIPFGKARWKAASMIFILAAGMLWATAEINRKAEFLALKETDPEAYLAELKNKVSEAEWLRELKELSPVEYERELAFIKQRKEDRRKAELEKRQRQEEERKSEIAKLVDELKRIPASDLLANKLRYERLTELDPPNKAFDAKFRHYEVLLDRQDQRKSHPETALEIVSWSWAKAGFNNIMMATFTIKNNADFEIKDIKISCKHFSSSGTQIDSNNRTIYELFPAGQTKTIKGFNMGFIHAQASQSNCSIVFAKRI